MRYGSVCSGIEAASVAWHSLGWKPAWFSEIEAFPSAVLNHRFPHVPNLGDMTTIESRIRSGEVEAPEILVGGTPCQAFSVAGLRGGLSDERGALTLEYVRIANAIDDVRSDRGDAPCIIVWENVPGVLSSKDNAFGCFLAGLAGEDEPLQPAGKRWSNAGAVLGPQRAIAWRVLDAQYFGVAQRRRRVFVVASARDGFDPAAVLFEFDGLRRDSPPSREAGEEPAKCITRGAAQRFDAETETMIPAAHTLLCEAVAFNWQGGGTQTSLGYNPKAGVTGSLHVGQTPAVALALRGREGGATAEVGDDCAFSLRASTGGGDKPHVMVGMAVRRLTHHAGRYDGDTETFVAHTLRGEGFGASEYGTGRGVPTIAFTAKDYGGDAMEDVSPTLRAGGHSTSHANAGVMPAVCFVQNSRSEVSHVGGDGQVTGAIASDPGVQQQHYVAQTVSLRGREGGGTAELGGETATALRASTGGGDKPHVLVFQPGNLSRGAGPAPSEDVSPTLKADQGRGRSDQDPHVMYGLAVRRLTPRECERLQGFPDDWTLIPTDRRNWHRERDEMRTYFQRTGQSFTDDELDRLAADGPRYKAIGNSMAVPVMHWIGWRIDLAVKVVNDNSRK